MAAIEPLALDKAGPSRRFRLRHATHAEHARLDALITGAGFLTARPQYMTYLAATLAARFAIEQALDAAGAESIYPLWRRRRIANCLRRDLDDLGHSAPIWPEPLGFPMSSRGEILGALYVLEGASLGARLLQKAVAGLGLDATFGARHIATQIGESAAWPRFTSLLDGASLDELEETACVETAVRAFGRFEHVYRRAAVGQP